MNSRQKIISVSQLIITIAVLLSSALSVAQQQGSNVTPSQEQIRSENQTPVYGWQLMTPSERLEMQRSIRNAKTEKDRQKIRDKNHRKMQQRAKDQGVNLRDNPGRGNKGKGKSEGRGKGQG